MNRPQWQVTQAVNSAGPHQPNAIRGRVLHTLYTRTVYLYANLVSANMRRMSEFVLLLIALMFLALLSYAHFTFTRNPPNCLEHVRPIWPREGILHVQVKLGAGSVVSTRNGAKVDQILSRDTCRSVTFGALLRSYVVDDFGESTVCGVKNFTNLFGQSGVHQYVPYDEALFYQRNYGFMEDENSEPNVGEASDSEVCVVEYAMEYGLLRLSDETRERLKIPIMYISLDPTKDLCFGRSFNQLLIDYVFGYDLVVMSSIKSLANDYGEKGFLRNLITGEQYRFMTIWMSRTTYISAFVIMILFTFSISAVLRFSNQQIFLLIMHLFNIFELNGVITLPMAHFISLILGLVGMEAVMTEFFSDANMAFFVILIVWLADQYNSICCTAAVSRQLWLRFFYLYHFIFYAYYYRFNGQFSYLALFACWALTVHSMVYFFHHYELPLIVRSFHVRDLITHLEVHPHLIAEASRHVNLRFPAATVNLHTAQIVVESGGSELPNSSSSSSSSPLPSVTVSVSSVSDGEVEQDLRRVLTMVDEP